MAKGGIEQHADADEEEEAEKVANRDDVAERLVAELRFTEDQAGNEGAEREGEAGQPGRIADADTDGDDGDEEKLARAPSEDEAEEPGKKPGAQDDDGAEEEHGNPDGAAEAGEKAARGAELRENDEHRYDGEVLHDEEADHDPARERVGDAGRGEHLQDDGGAGDGDHGAEPDRFAGRHGERERRGAGGERAGEQDLDGTSDQGDAADRLEVAEGELEAKGEEEERDADFGEELDIVGLDDGRAGGIWAHKDPGGDVADHQRKAQRAGSECRR